MFLFSRLARGNIVVESRPFPRIWIRNVKRNKASHERIHRLLPKSNVNRRMERCWKFIEIFAFVCMGKVSSTPNMCLGLKTSELWNNLRNVASNLEVIALIEKVLFARFCVTWCQLVSKTFVLHFHCSGEILIGLRYDDSFQLLTKMWRFRVSKACIQQSTEELSTLSSPEALVWMENFDDLRISSDDKFAL